MTNHRTFRTLTTAAASIGLIISVATAPAEQVQLESPDFSKSTVSLVPPDAQKEGEPSISSDTVIAKVNGDEIVFGDIQAQLQQMLSQVPQNIPPQAIQQQLPAMMNRILNGIVTEKLLKDKVEEADIKVTQKDVDEQIEEIKEQMPEGQNLEDILKMQGMTMDKLREQVKESLPIKKLIDKNVGEPKEPTQEEIKEFYEQNKDSFVQPEAVTARHILIGFDEDDDDDSKAKKLEEIKVIRKKIVDEDADFSEMAKEHSTGPTGSRGGSLGQFQRGQMVPAFEEVAFSIDIDKVSEPVETQFGYHLITVDEREEEKTVPIEEAEDRIATYLKQQDQQGKIQEYIEGLRDEADIEMVKNLSEIELPNAGK